MRATIRGMWLMLLQGDASKAHRVLGWRRETEWRVLCEGMVRADLDLTSRAAAWRR